MHPSRVEVTGALRPGKNTLEIRVLNLDWNFVKGHDRPTPIPETLREHYGLNPMPQAGGQARALSLLKKQSDFLLPSGLVGPVVLQSMEEIHLKP
jgi:hypothetical protein